MRDEEKRKVLNKYIKKEYPNIVIKKKYLISSPPPLYIILGKYEDLRKIIVITVSVTLHIANIKIIKKKKLHIGY